ncbi:MAG TPA: efflux RND transporter periplasmic adaptor subunit [Gemmatimonadaceae bacterium]|nr:efflux RND transporter periplasmic adaptor subunit [Gemmatimonadaceae bacterium]
MTIRSNRNSAIGVAVSVAFIVVAIAAVVIVQRRRARVTTAQPASAAIANMPGMSNTTQTQDSGARPIALPIAEQRALGITFDTVAVRPLVADTRASAVVSFDETRIAAVVPKFDGFAERVYVAATSQPVRRGQPLVDVYSPNVLAAEQDLLVAAELQDSVGQVEVPGVPTNAADLLAASRRRLELLDITPEQIDGVLRARRARRAFTLYSPATGIVVDKRVVEGQAVTAGQPLYTIADIRDVWIELQLPEFDAQAARAGFTAQIDVPALGGQSFSGVVSYVYPTLDTTSRTIRARIVVPNRRELLKPGMYATVHLRSTTGRALTVPTSAVLRTGERNLVFVDRGGGRLLPREIDIGRTSGKYTEVLSGLEAGQRVAASAQFLLDSEANLDEVMRSMISQMPAGQGKAGSR